MSGLDIYFQDMGEHALLNIATEVLLEVKKIENLAFSGYFSEAKAE